MIIDKLSGGKLGKTLIKTRDKALDAVKNTSKKVWGGIKSLFGK